MTERFFHLSSVEAETPNGIWGWAKRLVDELNKYVSGLASYTVEAKSATYSEAATSGEKVILVDTSSGNVTVNLPTAIGNTAKFNIKKTAAANQVTIDPNGTQTIDGAATAVLAALNASLTIVSDNTNWRVI